MAVRTVKTRPMVADTYSEITGSLTGSKCDGARIYAKDVQANYMIMDSEIREMSGGGPGGTPSNTVEYETSFGETPYQGVSTTYSRGDHTHGTPSDPVPTHEVSYDHDLLHSNANDPSAGEKAALAGTEGTPGVSNEYVTNDDGRNTNARTPTAHGHSPTDITGTAVVDNDARLTNARTPTAHDNTKHSTTYMAESAFSGLTKITVGITEPIAPTVGDLWIDTN